MGTVGTSGTESYQSIVGVGGPHLDDLNLTEVIIACELKWRYRNVDEARFMQFFGK